MSSLVRSPVEQKTVKGQHVLILGALSALGPLASDLCLPALPSLARDLAATMTQTQLTLSAAILGFALGQLTFGPLSDRIGRRLPLLLGMAVFGLASLACMFAPSVQILAFLRFWQGFAGAPGVVLALACARDIYSGSALARCLSLLMGVSFVAPMGAPVLGGWLIMHTSWRSVFLLLAFVGLALCLVVVLGLEETSSPSRRSPAGRKSFATNVKSISSSRGFVGYGLLSGFAVAAGMGYVSSAPFLLQRLWGISSQDVGFVLGINALGMVVMSLFNGLLLKRVRSLSLLGAGTMLAAFAGMSLLVAVAFGMGLVAVLAALFFLVCSLGLIMPNSANLALATIDPLLAGTASSLLGVMQFGFGALTTPLIGLAGSGTAFPLAVFLSVSTLAALAVFFATSSSPGSAQGSGRTSSASRQDQGAAH